MSSPSSSLKPKIIPEFDAVDLGIPFKVVLVDSVSEVVDPSTGEVVKTIIPNVPGLLKCVAMARILESKKLSGAELKFVRKVFGIPAKKLAERIGVTPEHLSRCEADDRTLSIGAEKCLRISLFLDHFKAPKELSFGDDCSEEVKILANKYENAFGFIKAILDDMQINPVHLADKKFELTFTTRRVNEDLFEDDPNASWQDSRKAA